MEPTYSYNRQVGLDGTPFFIYLLSRRIIPTNFDQNYEVHDS